MITATMLHSVSYAGLWGQVFLPVDAFINKAAELGYEGVMLMAKRPHLSVLDTSPRERARLRAQLEKKQLRAACLAGYTNFTADLEHGEIPHQEMQIHYVVEMARLARDLGGSLVRIFTGYEHPASPYAAQWKLLVEVIRECARRAAEHEVIIGVQNHHDMAVSSEALHDLIRAVNEPNCRAMFDAWAPALQGDDLVAAARKMAAMTIHTTIANYQIHRRFHYNPSLVNYVAQLPTTQAVPIEEGFIDYRTFIKTLDQDGFTGSVAYEMCSPLRDGGSMEVLDRYARQFVEFINEVKGEMGFSAPGRLRE